jgi:hypothetical protein
VNAPTPLAVRELLKKAEAAGLSIERGGASATVRQGRRTVVEFVWYPTVAYLAVGTQTLQRAYLSHVARALDSFQVTDRVYGRQPGDVLVRRSDEVEFEILGVVADQLTSSGVRYVVRVHGAEGPAARVRTADPDEFYRP